MTASANQNRIKYECLWHTPEAKVEIAQDLRQLRAKAITACTGLRERKIKGRPQQPAEWHTIR